MSLGPMVREAYVDGISLWSPHLPGWSRAVAALRGDAEGAAHDVDASAVSAVSAVPDAPSAAAAPSAAVASSAATAARVSPSRPAPTGLPANERRRAPDSVLVALQVAEEAVTMSGHPAATLPSIFTSAHGDLPIIDALLRTLAREPQLLSPTRFHHSVHNAPSGYWTVASRSHAASTALAAYDSSFAAGLLEALVQLAADATPVLLAGCDTEATGALASVNASRGLLGVALVLAPQRGPRTSHVLRWHLEAAHRTATALRSAAARALASNAMADALPLFEALARPGASRVALRCAAGLTMHANVQPCGETG